MTVTSERREDGIRLVTMSAPPVNALTVQGWYDVAGALDEASADPATKVVVLRAEGKGFNAGVDIKEMQGTTGFDALLGANKGCYAAFKAVYECSVPVIAAVNGFCVGGGVGLVGNADCVVASEDAYFGVPEVNQGALGAATHMARLVPQHMMRTLYFTARTIPAHDLVQFGSVLEVVPREEPRRGRPAGRPRHRRQGHPRDPRRQGGAQRDRPGQRQQVLPVGAGLHLRDST
ncbi:enoyl-CoA hydratase family protein [Nocardioides convexus]|uniref:enoyl-CoA hydratase family protein n=1 Tax=Nocardioides convexus TaxID=2712224 RepID=UPI0024182D80|nr:enoyl-CoA hydratase family protein [Nocardioides convexus]